jgi:hypothetical protein
MLKIGDTVKATRPLTHGIVPAGTEGVVTDKFVPIHAACCWHVTVEFTLPGGLTHTCRFDYPTDAVKKL